MVTVSRLIIDNAFEPQIVDDDDDDNDRFDDTAIIIVFLEIGGIEETGSENAKRLTSFDPARQLLFIERFQC